MEHKGLVLRLRGDYIRDRLETIKQEAVGLRQRVQDDLRSGSLKDSVGERWLERIDRTIETASFMAKHIVPDDVYLLDAQDAVDVFIEQPRRLTKKPRDLPKRRP